MNATKKTDAMKRAFAAGSERAGGWLKRDETSSRVDTVAAWRAVSYADAVLEFERMDGFMRLLTEWERGFDSTVQAVAVGSVATGASDAESEGRSPLSRTDFCVHPQKINRAPYELSYLLNQLPTDLSSTSLTKQDLVIAGAARNLAMSANHSLMSGLEALGKVMSVAGGNADDEIDSSTVADLGSLVRHMAAEARFLQETESYLNGAIDAQIKRMGNVKQETNRV